MRILIVDDDELLAHMLSEQLKRLESSFDVLAANTAQEARQAVQNADIPFEAFILDQKLDGSDVNGVALMGQLRDLNPDSDTIILTGYNDTESGIAAFDMGAYRYLTKPFDTRELIYVLKSIEKSRSIRTERHWLQILTEVTTTLQHASTQQEVADAIVQGALRFDFKRARLRLFTEQGQEAQGDPEMVGVSQAGNADLKGFAGLRAPLGELLYSRQAIEAGKPVIFKGREAGKGAADDFFAAQNMQPPVGEWVKIPLLSGSNKVGTLTLDNDEQDFAFSPQQRNQIESVLGLFGNQAAAALERARLHEQTTQQAKEAKTLGDIGRCIMTKATNGKLDDLLDEVRQQVGNLMDVTNFMVVLSDLETDALDFRSQYEGTNPEDRHWRASDAGLSGYVITHNKPVLTNNTNAFRDQHKVKLYGRRAECWLGVPLCLDNTKAFGALVVQSYSKEESYTDEHKQLLGKIADQIAGAIHAAYQREREEEKKRQDKAANRLNEVLPRLIEESEDGFWHAVLTTITHKEGNSFNRALLFLQSPASDGLWIGRMAVGHWTREDARRDWERDRDDNNKTLQDYFAAPYRAFSNPTPLQQKVLQWRLTPAQVEMLRLSERKTTTSSKLEGALPERELLYPPGGLLDGATDYDCALLPVKQDGKVIGVLWVDNAFDGEPLRRGDLDKVEELLAQAVEIWQQAQERSQSRLLGEKYENILALNRRINERAAARPLQESLQDLCDQSIRSIISADCVVVYPYLAETGAYDLENVAHCGLDKGNDFIFKNKPRQQGVTFSVLQSGTLVVPDVERPSLRFSGKRLAEHSFIQREAIKALMAVPMRKALTAEPLGVIYFDYRTAKKFTEQDIARAEHLATIGATAITYARDFGKEKQGREQAEQETRREQLMMQLVANIQTQALASDVDEEKLIRSILLNTAQRFEFPVKITLAVLDWQGEGDHRKLMRRDYHLTRRGQMRRQRVEISAGVIGQVLEQNKRLYKHGQDLIVLLRAGEKSIAALAVQQPGKKVNFSSLDEVSLHRLGRASELAWDSLRRRKDLQAMTETIGTVSASTDLAATLNAIVTYARKVAPELDCVTMWYADAKNKEKLIPGPQWNVLTKEHSQNRAATNRVVRGVMNAQTPIFAKEAQKNSILKGQFIVDEKIVSAAALPLRFGEKSPPLGALFLNYRRHHAFSPTEQALFTAFADAAAMAIHNAQILELVEQRKEQFDTALKVATAAGAGLDLDTVLKGILQELQNEFSRKDTTAKPYIMLYDDREDILELPEVARKLYQPTKPEYADPVRLPLDGKGITCDVARRSLKEKKVIVENAQNVRDKKYQGIYVEVNSNTQSELCAGLVSEDRLLGALVIKSDKLDAFNKEDEKLFEMAARQVALTLDLLYMSALAQDRLFAAGAMAWASDIAHDINDYVGYIRNRTYWLETKMTADLEQRKIWAREIDQQAVQLKDILREALTQQNEATVKFSFGELLNNKVYTWQQDYAQDVHIPPIIIDCDHEVYAHEEYTWSAVKHLLRNAVEAMDQAKSPVRQIKLRLHRFSEDQVELQIQDTGPGINLETRRFILPGPFFAPINALTNHNSSGSGLRIARGLIEAMKGTLYLYPLSDAAGTLFAIRLPSHETLS